MKEITNFISKHPDIIRYRTSINDAIDTMRAQFLDRLADEVVKIIKAEGYAVESSGNLSRRGSALQIAPRPDSSLNRLPVKIWIENVFNTGMVLGIKIPDGYKKLPTEAQLLIERMNRFLDENAVAQGLRQSAPNEAWAAGWQVLINQDDDAQLAAVINKDIALTASALCETIFSQIALFERAALDPAQPAATS